jgi:hypothetical protein
MSKTLAIERETIILFNEGEATAEIETPNAAMKRRLETVRRGHPKDITLSRRDGYADTYIFPKKWIKIIPPRRATEKQREHLKQARANIKQ